MKLKKVSALPPETGQGLELTPAQRNYIRTMFMSQYQQRAKEKERDPDYKRVSAEQVSREAQKEADEVVDEWPDKAATAITREVLDRFDDRHRSPRRTTMINEHKRFVRGLKNLGGSGPKLGGRVADTPKQREVVSTNQNNVLFYKEQLKPFFAGDRVSKKWDPNSYTAYQWGEKIKPVLQQWVPTLSDPQIGMLLHKVRGRACKNAEDAAIWLRAFELGGPEKHKTVERHYQRLQQE